MTKAEFRTSLIVLLNSRIDLLGEWISEAQEASIFGYLVDMALPFIPDAVVPFLDDAADGLDIVEIKKHHATALAAAMRSLEASAPVYLWLLFGGQLHAIMDTIIGNALRFAQKGLAISTAVPTDLVAGSAVHGA